MVRLFRAFFYKISKDITFRITLFIALGFAIFTTVLYYFIGGALKDSMADQLGEEAVKDLKILTGPTMLFTTVSPVQNFGISLPINLISYTYLEFTQGTIRNKIISGHSKFKIYSSLFLTGLVFTFILLIAYVGLCTGLGSIIGGFDINGNAMLSSGMALAKISPEFLVKFIIVAILTYVSIVSFTILVITVFRQMGPAIPVVILALMACYMLPFIMASFTSATGSESESLTTFFNVLKVVDPLYGLAVTETEGGVAVFSDLTFYGSIGCNLAYTAIFFGLGSYIFKKRDIK